MAESVTKVQAVTQAALRGFQDADEVLPPYHIEAQTSLTERPLRSLKFGESFAVLDAYGGGTFGPTRVSERGRRFLARLLEQLTDAQLTDLFAGARFDEPRNPLYRTSPVPEWVSAFKTRVRAISEGPTCPDA